MMRGPMILWVALVVLCVAVAGLVVKRQLANPMASRGAVLEADIDSLVIRPVFYIEPSSIDYDELNKHVVAHPKLWQELVPPPERAAPVAKGPDFKTLLMGVLPSKRREMKVGGTVKVHTVTPGKPRGFWATVGDTINGMKVVKITPTHLVFEKYKNDKAYTHDHPRR